MDSGIFVSRAEAESTTLAEALDRYLREITPTKKPSTQSREAIRARVIAEIPLARRSLASIKGSDIATFIRGQRPKLPGGRTRRLVDDEHRRLVEAASKDQGGMIGPLIIWAIETAMRRGEIAAMRWEHLDRKDRVLLIPETKNGTPRQVPLSTAALAVLDALPRRLDGRVWGMRPDSISQAFERVCKAAGIEGLTFHDLRHEATSRLFEKGLNPMEVAAITGHKTLQMLKRYTHLKAKDLVGRLG